MVRGLNIKVSHITTHFVGIYTLDTVYSKNYVPKTLKQLISLNEAIYNPGRPRTQTKIEITQFHYTKPKRNDRPVRC